jgi:hypothetical protein
LRAATTARHRLRVVDEVFTRHQGRAVEWQAALRFHPRPVPEAEFLTRLVEHIGRAGTHAADNDLQIQPGCMAISSVISLPKP